MSTRLTFLLLVLALGFVVGCGGGGYQKNAADELMLSLQDQPTFTIILQDMDVQGTFSKSYVHKYRVITPGESGPAEYTTDWGQVSEAYFQQHENDLGMEIITKDSTGKVSKVAAPPGYANYVGNTRYGEWRTHNGETFWSFYGKYAFMSSMFNMMTRPVYRREYDGWYGGGYYGSRPYYGGTSGSYKYGTRSQHAQNTRKDFFSRKQAKNNWTRSSSRSRSGGRSRSSGRGWGK